jgi:hypothetical protein
MPCACAATASWAKRVALIVRAGEEVGFAMDSALEESGFELLVPVRATREPEAFGLFSEYAAGAEGGDIRTE